MRRTGATLMAAVLATSAIATPADANGVLDVVVAFDAAAGELPEGVAADRRGNVYVSLGPPFFVGGGYGAVRKIEPDGSQTSIVELPAGPAPAGLAVDRRGVVWYAVPDPFGGAGGVYRITDAGSERVAGTETMLVPNGLAFDPGGNVYVTDSLAGEIRRVRSARQFDTPAGQPGAAETWLADELLAGCNVGDIGANGIAVRNGDVYVASTSRGMLLRVPIEPDGAAGPIEILAGDADCEPTDPLFSIDGIAIDRHGDVYAALVLVHRLVRIAVGSGEVTPLLGPDDGLWNPASVAFGAGRDHGTLLITNYAVLPPAPEPNLGPALLAYDTR